MKRIKKLVSLILAMAMVLGMSAMAFADDSYTITINQNEDDKSTHTYDAYQIFSGELAPNPGFDDTKDESVTNRRYILSNIDWGAGVNGSTLLTALKADTTIGTRFADCANAADVAAVLATFTSSTDSMANDTDTFATIVNANLTNTVAGTSTGANNLNITVEEAGYYLVKDAGIIADTNAAATRFLLEVVGPTSVDVKSEIPGGTKQVYVVTDNGTVEESDANYATIGSNVSYVINSNVPNHAGYDWYYFIMNDTLGEGLTFDADSVSVSIDGAPLTKDTNYYVYTGANAAPNTFRLAFADIMAYPAGAEIVVTYSATINENAKVGVEGNPNTWTLQYSNNPNETHDGDRPDDENKPGLPAEGTTPALGTTPEDITLTYLTELDITKYANDASLGEATQRLLAGAEFTLEGESQQVVLSTVKYYRLPVEGNDADAAAAVYYLLKDGTYTTQAPGEDMYELIGMGNENTFEGYLKANDGTYYVPEDVREYNGQEVYKRVRTNESEYENTEVKYVEDTVTETSVKSVPVSMRVTTGENGFISFAGLGAGSYTLRETVTPAGYNTLDEIHFDITFTPPATVNSVNEVGTWGLTVAEENEDIFAPSQTGGNGVATGVFAADVINVAGSLLPATGGIGTTIFYVLGTVLVLGAGILLVVRKRMSKVD